jgi:hypothetical protein
MLQRNYTWGASEEAGTHDALLFNRREGPEVSKMIQAIVDRLKLADEADVHRVEDLIANELPGNIRKWERVEQWLLGHPAAENSAVSYVKKLSDGLGFSFSESDAPPEIFSVAMPPNADSGQVLDALLELSRRSDYVKGYGIAIDYDPDVDYFDTKGLKLLFPGKEVEDQGWYDNPAWDAVVSDLIYYNSETEEEEAVGDKIIEKFKQSTREQQGLVIYCYPEIYEKDSLGHAGVYILGGIDLQSGRLVGFMIQNVVT